MKKKFIKEEHLIMPFDKNKGIPYTKKIKIHSKSEEINKVYHHNLTSFDQSFY